MLRLVKRNGIYQIIGTVNGKRIRKSTGTTDPKQARALIAQHETSPPGTPTPCAQVFDMLDSEQEAKELKSFHSYASHVKQLRAYFGDTPVNAIASREVAAYVAAKRTEGRADATINRDLQYLKQALDIAKREGYIDKLPVIVRRPERNVRQGFCTPEEMDRLQKTLPEYLRAATLFAFYTGMRRGELCALEWKHVDEARRVLRVPGRLTKNGQPHTLPLPEKLWQIIHMQPRHGKWLFHRNGHQLGDFRKAWTTATNAAGLPGLLFHDLRRSAVYNLRLAGVPEVVCMQITGHKTRSVFDRYNIVTESETFDALERVTG